MWAAPEDDFQAERAKLDELLSSVLPSFEVLNKALTNNTLIN